MRIMAAGLEVVTVETGEMIRKWPLRDGMTVVQEEKLHHLLAVQEEKLHPLLVIPEERLHLLLRETIPAVKRLKKPEEALRALKNKTAAGENPRGQIPRVIILLRNNRVRKALPHPGAAAVEAVIVEEAAAALLIQAEEEQGKT
jgi:hypothetical protein